MIKILHTADLHLDSPFDALPEESASQRRKEQRALLTEIIELAVREGVQLLLFSGDLLDSDSSYAETAEHLIRTFSSIDIPIFISPGNHDYYAPSSPYMRLKFPDNVHIFSSRQPNCVELPRLSVRVWGAAFLESHSSPLLSGFQAQKDDGMIDIMCLHGDVGTTSDYNPISEDELSRSGMDYVALGHVHSFSGLRKAGDTFFAWPGCPEGRGFDETGEKGLIIAELEPGSCELSFIPLSGRRYEIISVDLTDSTDHFVSIESALPAATKKDIYRIILSGECDNAPELGRLSRALESRFYSLQLKDRTRPRRDIWDGTGRDTLRGLFLDALRTRYNSAQSDSEREQIIRAVRWGIAALDEREEPYEAK